MVESAGSATRAHDKRASANYRPEIEGVRAVAAILVAVFHIWLGRVSGGVDVFFVIAGFLTTITLLGHITRTGRVSASGYLLRLAARLFPAAAVVLAVVGLLTPVLLVSSQWQQTFTEILASALYVENWWLFKSGNDYLARDNFQSPVQNFWAMSVQGQFYVIWLVFFLVAMLIVRARLAKDSRRALTLLVAVGSAASLAYAVYAVGVNQSEAYYNTFARVWEFGLGSLSALLLSGVVLPGILRAIAGWVGLAGIVLCGFVLNAGATFPGPAALWPTLAAVLVIVSGTGGPARGGVQNLLARRPLVWFGGISYGFYLWHWPILIFVIEVTGHRPDFLTGAGIIASAVLLAWLTHVWVEKPAMSWIRVRPSRARPWAPVAALVLVAALAGGGLVATDRATESDLRATAELASSADECFGAGAVDAQCETETWTESVPRLNANLDRSPLESTKCRTSTTGVEVKRCTFGVEGSDRRVLLIGNSHAAALLPAVVALAEQHGWEVTTYYKANCVFNTAPRRDDPPREVSSCLAWGESLRAELAQMPPFLFAVNSYSARKSVFLDAEGKPSEDAGVAGFREAWAPLIASGTPILAIADNPVVDAVRDLNCTYRPGSAEDCSVDRDTAFAERDLIIAAAQGTAGVYPLDLTDVYCDESRCPLVIGGVKVLRDKGHLTRTFAETLAPLLDDAVSVIPGVEAAG
ncbi:acyltransferase family protein [Microbacterium proteolyticum]|uniref:acyltransferase family protein n=1 Tax=Microbacterium proteolyticum TaxID=1572644 RepID=UPI0024171154|nr:acyltransferase family protein [Microbacterium proteolyticum]